MSNHLERMRPIEYICPFCKGKSTAQLPSLIDVAKQSSEYSKLMDGTLTEIACGKCDRSAPFEYSLQIVDTERNLILWLAPPNDPFTIEEKDGFENICGMHLRRVADMNILREVAAIFRDGLQDGAMLLLKHMLAARILQDSGKSPILCSYEQRASESTDAWLEFVLFFSEDGEPEIATVPFAMYSDLNREIEPIIGEVMPQSVWVGWDEATAERLWRAIPRKFSVSADD